MRKNIVAISIVIAVVTGGIGFYGGTVYEKDRLASQEPLRVSVTDNGNRQRGAAQNQQGRVSGSGVPRGGVQDGGFVSGDVIGKDAESITVKLRDGDSKIIYYSPSTIVSKSVVGAVDDLAVGESVAVNGATGQDGAVAAQSIQIRPVQQSGR